MEWGNLCDNKSCLAHLHYEAMNRATNTGAFNDESESPGTFKYKGGCHRSSGESVARPSSSPTCENEDNGNEHEVIIARLNEELANAKALNKSKNVGDKKVKKPSNKVTQLLQELNSPCTLHLITRKRKETDGQIDRNVNEKLVTPRRKREFKTILDCRQSQSLHCERACLWNIFSQVYHNMEKNNVLIVK